MPTHQPDPAQPPSGTPRALIDAGLQLFGQTGFAAASTRRIAALAQTNVASIAYHFGGKEGLHDACVAEVARRLSGVVGPPPDAKDMTPAMARAALEALVRAMVQYLLTMQGARDVVAFILRLMTDGSPEAIDRLYAALIEPRHRDLCQLWAIATGADAESEQTRLAVFSALGQVLYFRIGLPVVMRRMAWDDIGPAQVSAVTDTVVGNLRAMLNEETAT